MLLVGVSMRGMFSSGLPLSRDDEQKGGLEEFRALVEKLHFPQEYMKDDAYLMRYLSSKDFNLRAAFENLKRVLAVREAEKVDSIFDEDWSDLEKRFPYSASSVSKEGRAILYAPFGKWDFSKELAPGEFERTTRYLGIKMREEADHKAYSMIKGKNDIASVDIIYNFDGYSLKTHGCLQCIQMFRESLRKANSLHGDALNAAYIINAPAGFETIYPLLASALLDDKSREKVQVLGGQSSFEPVLLQHIDLDQFPNGILPQQ